MKGLLAALATAVAAALGIGVAAPAPAGPGGAISTDFSPADTLNGVVYAAQPITVAGTQKYIVGGTFTDAGSVGNDYITILNADGSVYPGFSPANALNGGVSSLQAITVSGEQKFLIGGNFTDLGAADNDRVAVLNSDGSTYTGFSPGARFNSTVSSVAAFNVDGVNKYLVGGAFTDVGGTTNDHLALLHANGVVDPSFAPGPGINGVVRSIAPMRIDGQIKFLVGGDFSNAGGSNDAIAVLNLNGSSYPGFAPGDEIGGVITSALPLTVGGQLKYLVTGDFNDVGAARNNRVAMFNPDGTVYTGFSPLRSLNSTAYAAAPVTIDGVRKYLVAGSFTDVGPAANDYLTVLNADGSIYDGFAVGPTFSFAVLEASTVVVAGRTRYLVGGMFSNAGTAANDAVALVDAPVITPPASARMLRAIGTPRSNVFTIRWTVPQGTGITQPVEYYRLTVRRPGRTQLIINVPVAGNRTAVELRRARLTAGLPPGRHLFEVQVVAGNKSGTGPPAVARFVAVR
ncbi:MAG TPA: hypothetical protein PLB21_05545 [Actinomycetota bacterium]|nr:hypothetical protein [Actinomycetota bacterium]